MNNSALVNQMGLETQLSYSTESPEEMHKNGGDHLDHYTQLLKYFNGKLVLPLGPHIILAASSFYPAAEDAKPKVHPTNSFLTFLKKV